MSTLFYSGFVELACPVTMLEERLRWSGGADSQRSERRFYFLFLALSHPSLWGSSSMNRRILSTLTEAFGSTIARFYVEL